VSDGVRITWAQLHEKVRARPMTTLAEEFGVSSRGLAKSARAFGVRYCAGVNEQSLKIVRCRLWSPRRDLFLARLPVPPPDGFGT
jgi:hypothetical protein